MAAPPEDLTKAFGEAAERLAAAGVKGVDRVALSSSFCFSSCGLSATAACQSGDELLRVPLHLCLTGRVEDAPDAAKPALEFVAPADDSSTEAVHRRLCARTWLEVVSPSTDACKAWLPAMQKAAEARSSASALRWGEDALGRCGPLSCVPRFIDAAQAEVAAIKTVLTELASKLPELCPRAPNAAEAEWLHLTCQSRSFLVRDRLTAGANAEGVRCLIPMLDFANTAGSSTTGTVAELVTGTIIVSSVAALQAGAQVLCSRSPVSNDELAVTSGSALPENANQQVALSLAFGVLRKEQLDVLKDLELDRFLRADENQRASVTLVLRRSDPFPNVAIVLARILTGSESSPELQKPVSRETVSIDRVWCPTLLNALKAQLQLYPMRDGGKEAADIADVVYDSSREVLKAAVGKLLEMTKEIVKPTGSE